MYLQNYSLLFQLRIETKENMIIKKEVATKQQLYGL